MRILSWNINGIRTLPQYHPFVSKVLHHLPHLIGATIRWNTFKSFHQVLLHLDADIICFQETKTSRTGLDKNLAVPDPFHAFFSFPVSRGGYSGVAVYTDSRTVTPLKAEEGLSGSIEPKVPLTTDERISRSYPSALEMELMPDAQDNRPSDLLALDGEGRALVLDFGLFVLINVYCPNETSDARLPFKMNYHFMLQERVNELIGEGREVIVVGDINICATPLDHCDGHLASSAASFHDHPARAWFHNWLTPIGCMTDVVRSFWPDRKGMYTCWNTKISARETNYGARVDYILATPGMLRWIKRGDIQPMLKGSDHCPIYIDLHDEITTGDGQKLSLREAMHTVGAQIEPPRLAARRWDEFSGRQTLLPSFFTKGVMLTAPGRVASDRANDPQPPGSPHPPSAQPSAILSVDTIPPPLPDAVLLDHDPDLVHISDSLPFATSTTECGRPTTTPSPSESGRDPEKDPSPPLKRTSADPPSAVPSKPSKKPKKDKAKFPGSGSAQRTLAAFFAAPQSRSQPHTRLPQSSDHQQQASQTQWNPSADSPLLSSDGNLPTQCLETDYQLALRIASSQEADPLPITGSTVNGSSSNNKEAWSLLMAPIRPPKCTVHGEPAKEYTVNKPGPNKGKMFFICSRSVGPGYDKGKGERPREEVDHSYRCNFFKWSADVRRETLKERGMSQPQNQP